MSNFRNAHAVTGIFQSETAATAAILEKEIISCPRNATDISLEKPDNYDKFSDSELIRALELLVSPEDLTIRQVAEAILKGLSFTPEEISQYLASGERLNAGAYFDFSTANTTRRKSVA